jgi:GNAT superfamily N-acetyltransferase
VLRVSGANVAVHLLLSRCGAVAEAPGGLAGAALWIERDGGLYLSRLAVAVAWRGRGITRGLVAEAERAAPAVGLPRLHLSTRLVLHDNRRLFTACGFVETTHEAHPGYAEPTFVNMEKSIV